MKVREITQSGKIRKIVKKRENNPRKTIMTDFDTYDCFDDIDDIDQKMAFAEIQVLNAFLAEVASWVKKVSFARFSKEIKKRVIGQENVDLILADIYNYLENISLGKKSTTML